MYNNFIKYYFLLLLLSCTSFIFSNAFAMDPPEGKKGMPSHASWTIEEKENVTHYEVPYSRLFLAKSPDGFIDYFHVGLTSDDEFGASLWPRITNQESQKIKNDIEPKLQLIPSFIRQYMGTSYDVLSLDKEVISEFLSVFYNKDMLPDYVVNRIIKHIGIEDFRINPEAIIMRINEQITQVSTVANIETIIFRELATIKNPVLRQGITWGLVQELNTSENYDQKLMINLCGQIYSPDLLFFKEAKLLQSDLAYTATSSEKSIRDHYKASLLPLLSITHSQNDKTNQNSLVNRFICNGALRAKFPDHLTTLNNLTVSPESTFELLDIIRNQEIIIHKQQVALEALKEKK